MRAGEHVRVFTLAAGEIGNRIKTVRDLLDTKPCIIEGVTIPNSIIVATSCAITQYFRVNESFRFATDCAGSHFIEIKAYIFEKEKPCMQSRCRSG